ncbi:transcriptional regulator, ArsR family [Methanosphaerula palustris E1-9c]|uniref:Transcriptional regulator, ArsR family n=1 Tax=Methanosphaerula palustris (strain ATCC BAA-1556 / DSM 19958 / E1-9c) TaxID=521011 RepID=B8GKN0_METPE|nr:transcriptional regulator, ArsR family [Methanosphaerula palustris E1-9c]
MRINIYPLTVNEDRGLVAVDRTEGTETCIVSIDTDFYEDLSQYLEVLSNSTRLRILKLIEKTPKDRRQIAAEINTSYDNTKKHLDKLVNVGLVKKEAGVGQQTSKGVHPVWEYSVVSGGLEQVIRNLGVFSTAGIQKNPDLSSRLADVRGQIADEFTGDHLYLVLLTGVDEGRVTIMEDEQLCIGRADVEVETVPGSLILPDWYRTVTRISKPHVRILMEPIGYMVEDCDSTAGTMLNGQPLTPHQRMVLHDGDLLDLANDPYGARFVVMLPKKRGADPAG